MAPKFRIIISETHNPWLNLATEEWIFQEMGDCEQVLFLWRNQETVVIGRSQNPWLECHLQKMQEDNVYLARRQSGGGAVFHDLGNTNFTFLSKKINYQREINFNIILGALDQFGIHAAVSGRNDIVIQHNRDTRKISGSAFKEKIDRAFHHGTLLLNADLNKLQDYLNPNKKKLESKGVKSARARVANLNEIESTLTHEKICEAIITQFIVVHKVKDFKIEHLKTASIPGLDYYYYKMQDWDWLYGQTLEFTHQFEERLSWGTIQIQLQVDQGVINDVRVYSDSLFPDLIDSVAQHLSHQRYAPAAINQALLSAQKEFPVLVAEIKELQEWLRKELI